MNENTLIKVDGVSKKFSRSLGRSIRYGVQDVARDLAGMNSKPEKLREDEFWAVDDVSFELKKGETLGIIGPNGSGKTTVLKMLNGIYMPDKGKIEVKGRIGALIQIGAGFHPMLSGRENTYVNGAILGMNKRAINKKFDSIVDFAEIGDFIDSPVKFYSTGMYLRLGFAIAVHCQPDILLVDEVLAVGDRDFQVKCFQKISELIKNGVSLVLVAHNEYAIVEYTSKALFLKKSKQMFLGESEEAITVYVNNSLKDRKDRMGNKLEGYAAASKKNKIADVTLRNSKMETIKKVTFAETLIVDFKYESITGLEEPIFGIDFFSHNQLMASFVNCCANITLPPIKGTGIIRLIVKSFMLPAGVYQCSVYLCEGSISNTLDWQNLENIIVEKKYGSRGLIKLEQKWNILS